MDAAADCLFEIGCCMWSAAHKSQNQGSTPLLASSILQFPQFGARRLADTSCDSNVPEKCLMEEFLFAFDSINSTRPFAMRRICGRTTADPTALATLGAPAKLRSANLAQPYRIPMIERAI
jgi:hypothetical protein